MHSKGLLILLFLFFAPFLVNGSVVINEIAWMGSSNGGSSRQDANDEWIELYNNGSETVDLNGWILMAEDGKPSINLSGAIPGGGFFLLERTDDNSVSSISADIIYVNALENGGEVLILKNSNGVEAQRIDAGGGWPAGDNSTKQTMQWDGLSWITADATPRAQNSGLPAQTGAQQNQAPTKEPAPVESDPEPQEQKNIPQLQPTNLPAEPAVAVEEPVVPSKQSVSHSVANIDTNTPSVDELTKQINELKGSLEEMQAIANKSQSVKSPRSNKDIKHSVFDTATQTQVANVITVAAPNPGWGIKGWLLTVLGFGIFVGIGFVLIRRQGLL